MEVLHPESLGMPHTARDMGLYLGGTGESQGEDTAQELPELLRKVILLRRHQKLLRECKRPKTAQEKQHSG